MKADQARMKRENADIREATNDTAKLDTGEHGGKNMIEGAKPDVPMDQLALQSDIYSYTFWLFVKNQNIGMISELMIKCFLTIMLQIALIYFKLDEVFAKNLEVNFGDDAINLCRLISCLIMHLYLYPEIRISLQML